MIADFHDCNADCPPDCKYKDTTSAHSRFKIYHFDNYYFKQLTSHKLYSEIQCSITNLNHKFCHTFTVRVIPYRFLKIVTDHKLILYSLSIWIWLRLIFKILNLLKGRSKWSTETSDFVYSTRLKWYLEYNKDGCTWISGDCCLSSTKCLFRGCKLSQKWIRGDFKD